MEFFWRWISVLFKALFVLPVDRIRSDIEVYSMYMYMTSVWTGVPPKQVNQWLPLRGKLVLLTELG